MILLQSLLIICSIVLPEAKFRCHNNCNGHGYCEDYLDTCVCWDEYEGFDCSYRKCPVGRAWADKAYDVDLAHSEVECSNRGLCNSDTGFCECFQGFSGNACEKTQCSSSRCNDRGECLTINELYQKVTSTKYALDVYTPWEANHVTACACDIGYFGPSCEYRMCPKGDDPMTPSTGHRTIKITTDVFYTFDRLEGYFLVSFNGQSFSFSPDATEFTSDDCKNAFEALPNVKSVQCSLVTSQRTNVYTVIFESFPAYPYENNMFINDGSVPLSQLTCSMANVTGLTFGVTCTVSDVVSSDNATLPEYTFCSNRGSCDLQYGSCRCFPDFTNANCDSYAPGFSNLPTARPSPASILFIDQKNPDFEENMVDIFSYYAGTKRFNSIRAFDSDSTIFRLGGYGNLLMNYGGITIGKSGEKTGLGQTIGSGGLTVTGGVTIWTGGASITGRWNVTDGLKLLDGGLTASGGATIANTGLRVTGGLTVSGGLNIESDGLYINAGGGTVSLGGVSVTGGLTVFAGGVTILRRGMSIRSGGLMVTGGISLNGIRSGFIMPDGLTIQSGGLVVTGGISAEDLGIQNIAGLTIANDGMVVGDIVPMQVYPGGGLTSTGGATVVTGGLIVTGGVTVNTGGVFMESLMLVTGGGTIRSGGMTVTGGVSVQNLGMVITGGITVEQGDLIIPTNGISLTPNGMAVTGGVTVRDSGMQVTGRTELNSDGIYVETLGMTIELGGMVVTGGVTVATDGLTLTGGVTFQDGGMFSNNGVTVIAGGISLADGATVVSGGIEVTGGFTVSSGGVTADGTQGVVVDLEGVVLASQLTVELDGGYVTGGVVVSSSGAVVTDGGTVRDAGMDVAGGLSVMIGGLQIDSGGASISSLGLVSADQFELFDGGMDVAAGLSVNSQGLTVDGASDINLNGLVVTLSGLTTHNAGIDVTGSLQGTVDIITDDAVVVNTLGMWIDNGMSVLDGGITAAGGFTVSLNGMTVTGGLSVSSGGLRVTGGTEILTGGMLVEGGASVVLGGLGVGGGMTVSSGGVDTEQGLIVRSGGMDVIGGVSVNTGAMVTHSLRVDENGINLSNGAVVVRSGGILSAAGLTAPAGMGVTGGVTVATGGVSVPSLTLSDDTAQIVGGMTVVASGIRAATGSLLVNDNGILVTGGMTTHAFMVTASTNPSEVQAGGASIIGNDVTTVNDGMTFNSTGYSMMVYGPSSYSSNPTVFSDERLKENITIVEEPLEKIRKMRGVYFRWVHDDMSSELAQKANEDVYTDVGEDYGILDAFDYSDIKERNVGLIAQQVQKAFPEVVNTIFGGKYLGIDYYSLVPLLIEAVRELDERTKNGSLGTETETLKKTLNLIKLDKYILIGESKKLGEIEFPTFNNTLVEGSDEEYIEEWKDCRVLKEEKVRKDFFQLLRKVQIVKEQEKILKNIFHVVEEKGLLFNA